jgi:hypothetical protein
MRQTYAIFLAAALTLFAVAASIGFAVFVNG